MKDKLQERILKQLGKRIRGYTSKELAEKLNANRNYVQRVLRKLVIAFKVESVGTSSLHTTPLYRIPKAQPVICE